MLVCRSRKMVLLNLQGQSNLSNWPQTNQLQSIRGDQEKNSSKMFALTREAISCTAVWQVNQHVCEATLSQRWTWRGNMEPQNQDDTRTWQAILSLYGNYFSNRESELVDCCWVNQIVSEVDPSLCSFCGFNIHYFTVKLHVWIRPIWRLQYVLLKLNTTGALVGHLVPQTALPFSMIWPTSP